MKPIETIVLRDPHTGSYYTQHTPRCPACDWRGRAQRDDINARRALRNHKRDCAATDDNRAHVGRRDHEVNG